MQKQQALLGRPAAWFLAAVCAVAILSVLALKTAREQGWGHYVRLMQKGEKTEAVITRTAPGLPGKDCLAEYSFSIAGRDYTGTGSQCGMRVGQKVMVTYLAADPWQSCLGRAGERLADEVVSYLLGGLTFAPLS